MSSRDRRGDKVGVVVCDDSSGFLGVAQTWIDADPRLELLGTASSAEELTALVPEIRPDVVLLDVVLPDVVEPGHLVEQLRHAQDSIGVVLISSMPEGVLQRAAEEAGADGFVTKIAGSREACDRIYSASLR